MPNYGLMTNIANGIKEGLLGYQTQKQIQRQEDLSNLMQGVQNNPETGQLEYTPQKKQELEFNKLKMANETKKMAYEQALENPESIESKTLAQNYKNIFGKEIPTGTPGKMIQGLLTPTAAAYKAETSQNIANMKMNAPPSAMSGLRMDAITQRATKTITGDQQLNNYKNQANSIDKGQELMSNTEHPVSVTTAHEILQDYANALSGAKGASDYKLKSITPNMLQEKMANLKTFMSSNPDQPAPPEMITFLKDMGNRLSTTYDKQIESRANMLGVGLKNTFKHTPQAVDAMNELIGAHKGGAWRNIGNAAVGEQPQAQGLVKGQPQQEAQPQTKEVNGVTYQKVPGGWKKVGP